MGLSSQLGTTINKLSPSLARCWFRKARRPWAQRAICPLSRGPLEGEPNDAAILKSQTLPRALGGCATQEQRTKWPDPFASCRDRRIGPEPCAQLGWADRRRSAETPCDGGVGGWGRRASLTTGRVVWPGVSSPLSVRSYKPYVSIGFRNRAAVSPSLVGALFGPSHFTLGKRGMSGQCQNTFIS